MTDQAYPCGRTWCDCTFYGRACYQVGEQRIDPLAGSAMVLVSISGGGWMEIEDIHGGHGCHVRTNDWIRWERADGR